MSQVAGLWGAQCRSNDVLRFRRSGEFIVAAWTRGYVNSFSVLKSGDGCLPTQPLLLHT
jgi:hypothetical protein